jgi:hypothetical protein
LGGKRSISKNKKWTKQLSKNTSAEWQKGWTAKKKIDLKAFWQSLTLTFMYELKVNKGCQIFLGATRKNWEKCAKKTTKSSKLSHYIPNGNTLYQMATIRSNRPSKIYQNWDFWF